MDGINHVKSLEWQSKSIGRGARWFSLIGALLSLWVIAFIFTKGHPTALFLGTDNRYSSSKFQAVLWFTLVISAYIAIVSHRIAAAGWTYVGGVDIPPNLLILSGISVLTFTAAKAITTGKVEGKPDIKTSASAPRATNLITDDNNKTDLGPKAEHSSQRKNTRVVNGGLTGLSAIFEACTYPCRTSIPHYDTPRQP